MIAKSIITHPASTTHQQLSEKELEEAGIPAGLVRLSVGLEDTQDLIDDLTKGVRLIVGRVALIPDTNLNI